MPDLALSPALLMAEGTEWLGNAGVADPRRQALRIWAELQGHVSGVRHYSPPPCPWTLNLPPSIVSPFAAAPLGEPLPYVTGKVGFRHLTLQIDRRALIPRPETEGLVELLLQRVRKRLASPMWEPAAAASH